MGNIERFDELVTKTFLDCSNILKAKGADYAGNKDRYANFKRNAELLGLTKYQVWSVYFNKHVDSLLNAVKENPETPETHSEAIGERVKDIINYALLFYGMIEEDKLNINDEE